MPKQSAGLLVYRSRPHGLEVMLVHPGGPFWAKKDAGAWSIPKGEIEPDEDPLERAKLEFLEETGFIANGPFLPLAPVKQSAKIVHAWALEGDFDVAALVSNTFEMEFPPRSGRRLTFPEVDRAGWFDLATARTKVVAAQCGLLDQLAELASSRSA